MTIELREFRPEILRSFEELKGFFRGDEEIEQVRALANMARPHPFGGAWQVAWLAVTAPLKLICGLFLWAIAPLLRLLDGTALAIHAEILGGHLLADVLPLTHYAEEGENYLAPLFNTYAYSASSVYLQTQMQTEALREIPEVYNVVRGFDAINFYQNGVCRGMSNWFIYLYLNTQDSFADAEDHLCALASLFYSGANSQAALLQALYYPEETLLRLHIDPGPDIPFFPNRIDAEFDRSEPGVYIVEVPYHRLAFIKVDEERAYLINPSEGIVRLRRDPYHYVQKYQSSAHPHNFLILSRVSRKISVEC